MNDCEQCGIPEGESITRNNVDRATLHEGNRHAPASFSQTLLRGLRKMRREKSRDRLLMRVVLSTAKGAKNFVNVQLPKADEPISPQTFRST